MSKEEMHRHTLKEWTDDIEILLKNISEKCQIWREPHMKTHSIFKKKYYRLTIPVIVLSSITGGANLSLGSISTSANNNIINLVIGAIGIIISILSTLNNIFSFSKRKDEHYRASNDWYRLHRLIKTELSLERDRRIEITKFFNMVMHEIERIHDYQPNIRNDVLSNFKKALRKKGKSFNIEMPEIINLSETVIYKKTSSNEENKTIHKMSTMIDIPETDEEISSLSSSHLEINTPIDSTDTPIVTAFNSVNSSPIIQKHGNINKTKKINKEQSLFNIHKDTVIDIDKLKTLNITPNILKKNQEETKIEISSELDNENINPKIFIRETKETDTNVNNTNIENSEEKTNENINENRDTNTRVNTTNNLGFLLNRVLSNVSLNNNKN